MYCKLLKESVSRLKGDEAVSDQQLRLDLFSVMITARRFQRTAGTKFGFIYHNHSRRYLPDTASIALQDADDYEEELMDRFGTPPDQVKGLPGSKNSLAQEANFDLVETRNTELLLRHTKDLLKRTLPGGGKITTTKAKKAF